MNRRILGRTGMSVSEFALGTMMLGAMGNTDHDESVRMIHTALDAGINVIDTAGRRNAGAATSLFDQTEPGNRAKAEAVAQLTTLAAEAGLTLPHLATAFVLSHPAITSVLIGPRTPEQLTDLLSGADVELSDDVLDRIDEIVPPGVNLNQKDILFLPSTLGDKASRRR